MTRKAPKLLVTIDEKKRGVCERQIRSLLYAAGVPNARLLPDSPQGLVEVYFTGEPKDVVARLAEICKEEPFAFAHTYHWTPVEAWSEVDKRQLAAYAKEFDGRIGPNEPWKIEIHKTDSSLSSHMVLDALAEGIRSPKVDLEHPKKVLHVELVGDKAAFSLLRPEERLDVGRLIRTEFLEFEELPGRGGPKPR